jgi:hypothetical protein
MTTEPKTRIPAPLYAAAGAGELAYRQLRRLPARVTELRGRVDTTELDVDRLRQVARRNAEAFVSGAVSGAQAAQERAAAIYTDLVTRGEQVVRGGAGTAKSAAREIEQAAAADQPSATKPKAKRTRTTQK